MVTKIIKVFQMSTRQYTDRQGVAQVFKSKGFILHNGDGTIYAEAVQEQADQLQQLDIHEGDCAFVQLASVAREYKTQQGETRYSNEFTIRQMVMIWVSENWL